MIVNPTTVPVEVARHLAAIHRTAAAKAYEANMAARNSSMNWILATIAATQSAMLIFAASEREQVANFPWVGAALLIGLLCSLASGIAHVRFCNEYAAVLYLDMQYEIEGAVAIGKAKEDPEKQSDTADGVTSLLMCASLLFLLIGAGLAIFGLK